MSEPIHNTAFKLATNLDEILRMELHSALEHAEADGVPAQDAMAAILTTLLTCAARVGVICCTPDRFLLAASRCYETTMEMIEEGESND